MNWPAKKYSSNKKSRSTKAQTPNATPPKSASQLTVDTVRKIAETPAAVHYRYGDSQGSAQGMTYDYQNGQLNLPAQVKALIYAKSL